MEESSVEELFAAKSCLLKSCSWQSVCGRVISGQELLVE